MTIQDLMKMEAGTTGINVTGKIAGVWPVKQGPYGPSQFMLITDGKETIAVQTKTTSYKESEKGSMVEIVGGAWRSYESKGKTQHVLDVPKNSTAHITITGAAPAADPKEVEAIENNIITKYKEALISGMELMNDEIITNMLTMTKEKGWETKDITAVAASLFIEGNKRR